ncbi:DgyrCDS8727 [Dimorphilus gyrociliatus]|uniref:DgyrCDS8727 n=1 Tax=Dimorphilus gyrociliatus TaxID=2664684 RepID=A0A7I8VV88_9ANNE|nr:DgyrCDS8727 [Dimorphilus gyrociliatus]
MEMFSSPRPSSGRTSARSRVINVKSMEKLEKEKPEIAKPETTPLPPPYDKPKPSFKEKIVDFTQDTTFHGVKNITGKGTIFKKLIWLVIVLSAFGGFTWIVVTRSSHLNTHPKSVNMDIVYSNNLQFPSVTICNQNFFRTTATYEMGLYDKVNKKFSATDKSSSTVRSLDQCSDSLVKYQNKFMSGLEFFYQNFSGVTEAVCEQICLNFLDNTCNAVAYNKVAKTCHPTSITPESSSEAKLIDTNVMNMFVRKRCNGQYRPITCDFENDLCSFSQSDSLMPWIRNSGPTGTLSTGPPNDHTSGHGNYIYIEATNRNKGEFARLTSPFIQAEDEICLEFYYNMFGKDSGVFSVLRKKPDSNETILWSRTTPATTDLWNRGFLRLESGLFSIVFEAIIGSGALGDIAIDDVTIAPCHRILKNCKASTIGTDYQGNTTISETGKTCLTWKKAYYYLYQKSQDSLLVFPDKDLESAGNMCRNPDSKATGPWCYVSLNGTWENCIVDYCPCNKGQFTCNNKVCISTTLKCNGVDNCGDNSDEINNCDVSIDCDFEKDGSCGFKSVKKTQGQLMWQRYKGATKTTKIGTNELRVDHTTSSTAGYYMLFDSFNSMAQTGQKANLETPFYAKGNTTSCLTFYLFQYTRKDQSAEKEYPIYTFTFSEIDSMGSLSIIQYFSEFEKKTLWRYQGTQDDEWLKKQIRIKATSKPYKIIFQAEMNFQMKSDIAIDDVSIKSDECLEASNYYIKPANASYNAQNYTCDNGKEISRSALCNGVNDCFDNSDEIVSCQANISFECTFSKDPSFLCGYQRESESNAFWNVSSIYTDNGGVSVLNFQANLNAQLLSSITSPNVVLPNDVCVVIDIAFIEEVYGYFSINQQFENSKREIFSLNIPENQREWPLLSKKFQPLYYDMLKGSSHLTISYRPLKMNSFYYPYGVIGIKSISLLNTTCENRPELKDFSSFSCQFSDSKACGYIDKSKAPDYWLYSVSGWQKYDSYPMKTTPGKVSSNEHKFTLVSPSVLVQDIGCFIIKYLPLNAKLFKLKADLYFWKSDKTISLIDISSNLALKFSETTQVIMGQLTEKMNETGKLSISVSYTHDKFSFMLQSISFENGTCPNITNYCSSTNYYICETDKLCIGTESVCNGEYNCPDQSDENNCTECYKTVNNGEGVNIGPPPTQPPHPDEEENMDHPTPPGPPPKRRKREAPGPPGGGGGPAQTTAAPGGGGGPAQTTAAPGGGGGPAQTTAAPGGGGGPAQTTAAPGGGGGPAQTIAAPGGGGGPAQTTAAPGGGGGPAQTTAAPGGGGGPAQTTIAPGGGGGPAQTTAAPGSGGGPAQTTAAPGSGSGSGDDEKPIVPEESGFGESGDKQDPTPRPPEDKCKNLKKTSSSSSTSTETVSQIPTSGIIFLASSGETDALHQVKTGIVLTLGHFLNQSVKASELFGKEIMANVNKLNITELDTFRSESAHQVNDIIYRCSWEGTACSHLNFTTNHTDYGVCFTFNSPPLKDDVLTTTKTGSSSGLSLILNIEEYEYMNGPKSDAGVKVFLSKYRDVPFIRDLGFAAAAGVHSLVSVKFSEAAGLKSPWGNCGAKPLKYYPEYTYSSCERECETDAVEKLCGCRDSFMPATAQNEPQMCNVSNYFDCIIGVEDQLLGAGKNLSCICSEPCERSAYEPSLSYASLSSLSVEKVLNSDTTDLYNKYKTAREINQKVDSKTYLKNLNLLHNLNTGLGKLRKFVEDNTKNPKKSIFIKVLSAKKYMVDQFIADINRVFDDFSDFVKYYKQAYDSAKLNFQKTYDETAGVISRIYQIVIDTHRRHEISPEEMSSANELLYKHRDAVHLYRNYVENRASPFIKQPIKEYLPKKIELTDAERKKCTQVKDSYYEKGGEVFHDVDSLKDHSVYFDPQKIENFQIFIDGFDAVKTCLNTYLNKWTELFSWKVKILDEATKRSQNTSSAIENFDFYNEWETLGKLATTTKMLYEGYRSGNISKLNISETLTDTDIDFYLADLLSFRSKIQTRLSESTFSDVGLASATIKNGYTGLVSKIAGLWDHFEGKAQTSLKNTLQNMTFWLRLVGNVEEAKEPYQLHSTLSLPDNIKMFSEDMAKSIIEETADIYLNPLNDALVEFNEQLLNLKIDVEVPLKKAKIEFSTYRNLMLLNENFVQKNFLIMDVFFAQLKYERVEQIKAYNYGNFFSEVGGFMGLLLGGSVISVMEIFDFLLGSIMKRLIHRGKVSSSNSNYIPNEKEP